MLRISNGSKKRCREKFGYKGIGRLINTAERICSIDGYPIETVISEFIYDYDNIEFYNVLWQLYRIRPQ